MKQKLLLIINCLIISLCSFSQDSTSKAIVLTDVDSVVFEKVEVEASFPGGIEAWRKYLVKNLKVTTPIKNGAPAGVYKVVVRFIVSKRGSISAIAAETSVGYGMEAEVIRIMTKSPKWTPATQNGKAVNAYRRQPITFMVSDK